MITSKFTLLPVCACLLLGGCFSADVSSSADVAPLIGKKLTIQRPSLIFPAKIMKSVAWGGDLEVFYLQEVPRDFAERVARGEEKDSIPLPVGTEVRLQRVERRNLIDHGVEVLAFGQIQHPRTGKWEPFVFWLTSDGGSNVVRAPWEDSTVPALRRSEMTGIRDFRIGPAVNEKKD